MNYHVCCMVLTILGCTTSWAQATGVPALDQLPHISSKLYFAGEQQEKSLRDETHAHTEITIARLRHSTISSLPAALRDADHCLIALQRHAGYLKLRALEDVSNQSIQSGRDAVEMDVSALTAAIATRLNMVHSTELRALGQYQLLATTVRSTSPDHRLSPDATRYREEVVSVILGKLAARYKQLAAAPKTAEVTQTGTDGLLSTQQDRTPALVQEAPEIATLLGTIVAIKNSDAIAQGFENAALRQYQSLGIGPGNIANVLSAVQTHAPLYKRYRDSLVDLHESFNPDGSTTHFVVPFSASKTMILEGLAPLGNEYLARMSALLDPRNGRLDLSGGPHRAETGTSIAVYDAPTALFLGNYKGGLADISALTHEGGHAVHRELMNAKGIPLYEREGPHYLFEAIAILNELLVLDHAAETAASPEERRAALRQLTTKIAFEVFASAEETSFERSLYIGAHEEVLLDQNAIDSLYRKAVSPFETNDVYRLAVSSEWMRKKLLFEDPLYLVNYLYASIVACSLYEQAHSDPNFPEKYIHLLQGGFNASPDILMTSVGVDINDAALVDKACRLLERKLDELSRVDGMLSTQTR
ncbi:M3 family metallopeptidase [Granulicella sp. dw_53]|uniref:M3 family metallopeptidase n=1 Tax=Granulicella sp. dw_53 TaxID=2719792 RepID=UPI001BD49CC2|nr:M3 family metallopeptidase [Granulicella sp. dw_53]